MIPLVNDEIFVFEEEWKQLVYDGKLQWYFVSNTGKLYSIKKHKFMKFVNDRGWLRVRIKLSTGKYLRTGIHRLVALMFVDGYEDSLVVNHKDGNKKNNAFYNLEWMTQEENEKHAMKHGLKAWGERHYGNIYSENQIRKVCELLERDTPYDMIVEKTGVSKTVVYDVKSRKSWVNISDKYNIDAAKSNTKYSQYMDRIYTLFEQGFKTKYIMKTLGIPYTDERFKKFMNRIRDQYSKGLFVVQRLSPRGT